MNVAVHWCFIHEIKIFCGIKWYFQIKTLLIESAEYHLHSYLWSNRGDSNHLRNLYLNQLSIFLAFRGTRLLLSRLVHFVKRLWPLVGLIDDTASSSPFFLPPTPFLPHFPCPFPLLFPSTRPLPFPIFPTSLPTLPFLFLPFPFLQWKNFQWYKVLLEQFPI